MTLSTARRTVLLWKEKVGKIAERENESLQGVLCDRKGERLGQLRGRAWRCRLPAAITCGHGPTRALITATPQQQTGLGGNGKATVVGNMQGRERRVPRDHGDCMSSSLQRIDDQRGVCSIWHSNAMKPTNRTSLSTSSRDSLEASASASSCRSASTKTRQPCSASSR